MIALLDGDIFLYRIAWTTENEDFNIAKWRLNEMIDHCLVETAATSYNIYLSDSTENNFRFKLYPQYKQNRVQPKPKHYEALKYYMVADLGGIITTEQEADDILGITQTFHNENGSYEDYDYGESIICSIDKDLLQIPGHHYNFVKREKLFITPEEGLKRFYTQLLTGDITDNIPGIYGIGPVKANKLLEGVQTEKEMFTICQEMYAKNGISMEQMLLNGQLLKIRTKENEVWSFPQSEVSLEQLQ